MRKAVTKGHGPGQGWVHCGQAHAGGDANVEVQCKIDDRYQHTNKAGGTKQQESKVRKGIEEHDACC